MVFGCGKMNRTEELYNSVIRVSQLSMSAGIETCIIAILKLKKEYLESEKHKYDSSREYLAILGTYDAVLNKLEKLKTS